MSKTWIKATQREDLSLEVNVHKGFYLPSMEEFRLMENGKLFMRLKTVSQSESNSSRILTVKGNKPIRLVPGKEYFLVTKDNIYVPVDFSFMARTKEFEEKYRYDGPLGAIYSKERTTFRVFSPFATRIVLNVKRRNKEERTFLMEQDLSTGIFSLTLEGDYDQARYTYTVTVFGLKTEVVDPYAYSLDSNSRHGFVIDPNKVYRVETHSSELPPFLSVNQAIIYETNVRDMTSLTNQPNKGTYACLSRPGLRDEHDNPVGLDYLASLGVSHIQLQPIQDFQTVDDDNPFDGYNWGYDPMYYFAPEGSYSLHPNDPYSRVTELRELIGSLHAKGLRVIIDVVYNHVYSMIFNSLNILVPNYYFRINADKSPSNGTGCGNDFESRNYMARRIIVDSMLHLIDFYDIDGFRFDLMGILDIETLKLAYKEVEKVKKNCLFYGEGWDLWTNLPSDEKGSTMNARKLPEYAFFNDRFRDIAKGKTSESELSVPGYLLGDTNYIDGFKHVMLGSSMPLAFAPMFENPMQSLNYVECHDNHTLFDKIKASCPFDSEKEILSRIKMIDVAVLMALGIPFFHMGQEIGQSKQGVGNSYNSGDKINGFQYNTLEERKDMYEFFKEAIQLKKTFFNFSGKNYGDLRNRVQFENLEHNALKITYSLDDFTLYVLFNPTKTSFMYTFDDYVKMIFNETGNVSRKDYYVHLAIINALSAVVFLSTKRKNGGDVK